MSRHPVRLRTAALIAMFAVMLGALMPTLGRVALAGEGQETMLLEVCTPDGMLRLAVDDGSPGSGNLASMIEACAYCCPHAGSFGLPPALARDWSASVGIVDTHAIRPVDRPRELFFWAPRQPRAPPFFADFRHLHTA